MHKILAFVVLVLATSGTQPTVLAQGAIDADLARIYQEYLSFKGRPDVGRLVQLDQELRRLMPYWSWDGPAASSQNYRQAYDAIGVSPLLFEPAFLSYSGKLLREAHIWDPKSRRNFTLYSTVFGPEGEAGNALPSPIAAGAYLREFPSGPFAFHAHLAVANFFADLFKVIEAEEAGERIEYKYECFKTYITKDPLPGQRTNAQAQAVEHYTALARLRPDIGTLAEWLAELQHGESRGWHYCAD
jgi:hypothetical protein